MTGLHSGHVKPSYSPVLVRLETGFELLRFCNRRWRDNYMARMIASWVSREWSTAQGWGGPTPGGASARWLAWLSDECLLKVSIHFVGVVREHEVIDMPRCLDF